MLTSIPGGSASRRTHNANRNGQRTPPAGWVPGAGHPRRLWLKIRRLSTGSLRAADCYYRPEAVAAAERSSSPALMSNRNGFTRCRKSSGPRRAWRAAAAGSGALIARCRSSPGPGSRRAVGRRRCSPGSSTAAARGRSGRACWSAGAGPVMTCSALAACMNLRTVSGDRAQQRADLAVGLVQG